METQSEFFFCSGAATEVLKVGSSQLSREEVLLLLIPGGLELPAEVPDQLIRYFLSR